MISVALCTCNRSQRLTEALQSLELLLVPPNFPWELLVVDNNSSDETRGIVSAFERKGILPIRYMVEQRKGKSFALNRGIREARGKVIAFTDDDCIVSPHWLTSIANEFACDPSLAGIGGRVELFNMNDRAVCIRTYNKKESFSPTKSLALIFGCNMAFTKTVFDEIGGFDPTLGPGSICQSGEDLDFLYRAHKKGFKIVYTPDVVVYHNHGRKTDVDVRSSYKGYGIAKGALYCKHILRGDRDMLLIAYREARSIVQNSLRDWLRHIPIPPQQIRLQDLVAGALWHLSLRVKPWGNPTAERRTSLWT